jgi:hypothetical protein
VDLTDFEDFMDFFRICSGFFDEVYGIFGVKCPSVMCKFFFLSHHHVRFFLPLSLSQHFFFNSLYYLDSLNIVNVEFSSLMHCF